MSKTHIFNRRSDYVDLGEIPLNSMVKDNCLVAMKYIRKHSVHLILADLPYALTQNGWDILIPFDKLWPLYNQILVPKGVVVLTGIEPFTSLIVTSNIKAYKHRWLWDKGIGSNFLNAEKQPMRTTEDCIVFCNEGGHTYNPQMRLGHKAYFTTRNKPGSTNYGKFKPVPVSSEGDRFPVDVLKYPYDKNKMHPTQKPVPLFSYFIRTYTNPGDTVLDNTAGSGTTAIACEQTGRKWIVIEKDPVIFDRMKNRVLKYKHLPYEEQVKKDMLNDNTNIQKAAMGSLFDEDTIVGMVKIPSKRKK